MWRAGGVVAVALVSAVAALGAEASGNTTTAAPSPIEAAKRDYDALKDAKFSLEQQKLDLPKSTTPELRLGNDPLPGSEYNLLPGRTGNAQDKAKADAQRRGQRGTNWLVDAMLGDKDKAAKTGSAATSAADGIDKSDTEETGALKLADLPAKKGETTGGKAAAPDEKTVPPRVANPLDGYLAGWMTPGDYQLLKAAPEAGRGGAPAQGLPTPSGVPDLRGGAPSSGGLIAGLASGATPPASEPRVNPYLAEPPPTNLDFSAPTLVGPASASTSAPLPPPASLGPVSAAPEPAASKPSASTAASELIKARDDAKYFPQLKRF